MRRLSMLVLVCPLLLACGAVDPEDVRLALLEANQARWESLGPGFYTYAVERLCFCPAEYRGPVRVTVEDGVAVQRLYVDTGLAPSSEIAPNFPTVQGLFDLVRAAIEADAFEVRATYDPTLGVPLDLWIDYDQMVADEELGMQVTEVVTPAS